MTMIRLPFRFTIILAIGVTGILLALVFSLMPAHDTAPAWVLQGTVDRVIEAVMGART